MSPRTDRARAGLPWRAAPGKTKVTISWLPHNSDEAGRATFDGARAGMEQGFAGMWAKLESYLAELSGK